MYAVVARHLDERGRQEAARQVLGVERDGVGKVTAMCGMGMFKAAAQVRSVRDRPEMATPPLRLASLVAASPNALSNAITSQVAADDGDVDLMAFVLHEFERSFDRGRNRSAFYMGLAEFPRSMRGMVKIMAGESERKEVKAMLVKAGDVVEAGNLVVKEYLEERAMGGDPEKRLEEVRVRGSRSGDAA